MSHKLAIWETMRCRPITLVSATHGPDGQLHQEVIAGPRLALNSGLPEEGLYILYHNRGLQIASTACDQRRCGITQVCRCTERQHMNTSTSTSFTGSRRQQQQGRRCGYAALAWLHLYEAAETIRSLGLCFLAYPRALSWDDLFGEVGYHFDSDLEEHYAVKCTYKCLFKGAARGKACPPDLVLGFIRDVWRDFLEYGGHDFKDVATLDDDDDTDDDTDDDSREWDDADIPITLSVTVSATAAATASPISRRRTRGTEDEFDLFDDVIEEEFPRVKETLLQS